METWDLEDALIQSINFGDLSYSSADETELEVSLRYSEVTYTTACRDAWLKSPVCPPNQMIISPERVQRLPPKPHRLVHRKLQTQEQQFPSWAASSVGFCLPRLYRQR